MTFALCRRSSRILKSSKSIKLSSLASSIESSLSVKGHSAPYSGLYSEKQSKKFMILKPTIQWVALINSVKANSNYFTQKQ